MNSQLNPPSYPDARIDQVLTALRTTEPPAGLEQRIAARLTQATEARALGAASTSVPPYLPVLLKAVKSPRIWLAPAKLYTAAALTLVFALTTLTILHRRAPIDTNRPGYAQSPVRAVPFSSTVAKVGTAASATSIPSLGGLTTQSSHTVPSSNPALAEEEASVPFAPAAQDLESVAMAETLAPSRSAPPMPITAQEKRLQVATRPGQPIQLAELDLARAPVLHAAAEARETASIDRYVRSLLAPFAVADALQPTTLSEPQDAPAPALPTSNSSN